jgi:hypothetical protein
MNLDNMMSQLSMEEKPISNPNMDMNMNMNMDMDMDMDMNMDMNMKTRYTFMNDDLANNLFINNLDIYNPKERYLELGIPNIYCNKYFDDEDFIYAKLKIQQLEDNSNDANDNVIDNVIDNVMDNTIDYNVINYISSNNVVIDFTDKTLDTRKIYAKVLYLYQYVNSYYSSLSGMRPLERIKYMPGDLFIWIENIVGIMRYILDNDLFNFKEQDGQNELDTKIEREYFNELLYGLNLTVCHLKMLLNHYKILGIPIYNMEDKHIKKMFQVLNNMCVIIIYLRNVS